MAVVPILVVPTVLVVMMVVRVKSGSSSATGVVVLSTLVAVSGSYVFGTAVSEILL